MIDDFETDDELEARLARALSRADPVSSSVIAAARACGTWRRVEAELASLMYDSLEGSELTGVRGGGNRLLTFSSSQLTIELEILGPDRALIGQVEGTRRARVEVCYAEGAIPVDADDIGHFSCRSLPAGPMRVRVADDADGTVTQTEWIVI